MQMSARCAINNQKYLVEGLMGSCWMHSSLTAVQQFYNTDKSQLKTRGIKQQRQHTHVACTYVTLAAISIDQKCFYVTLKKMSPFSRSTVYGGSFFRPSESPLTIKEAG